MSAAVFNTIVSDDWRVSIARGRADTKAARTKIQLAVARFKLVKLLRGRISK